jgi:hypothetical protein
VVLADPELAFGVAAEPSELELFELELELFELEPPEFEDDLAEDESAEDESALVPDEVLLVLACVGPGS